jgi:AcrR family transcriptional regulator
MTPAVRPLRADAHRNREAILDAARAAFDAKGIYAAIDAIAVAAGVGNATLYRNFPTRDDLLAAVVEDSIGALLAEAQPLRADLAPDDALREWLFRVAWALRIWHDLPHCIAVAIDDDGNPVQDVPTRLAEQTERFLEGARKQGTVLGHITAGELVQLITALSWAIDHFGDDTDHARRRVTLATSGVFTRTWHDPT